MIGVDVFIDTNLDAGATVLWSEDFNTGQDYGGVRVINPLI